MCLSVCGFSFALVRVLYSLCTLQAFFGSSQVLEIEVSVGPGAEYFSVMMSELSDLLLPLEVEGFASGGWRVWHFRLRTENGPEASS